MGSDRVHDIGFYYVLFPSIVGSVTFVLLGILLNNLSSLIWRHYPIYVLPWKANDEDQAKAADTIAAADIGGGVSLQIFGNAALRE